MPNRIYMCSIRLSELDPKLFPQTIRLIKSGKRQQLYSALGAIWEWCDWGIDPVKEPKRAKQVANRLLKHKGIISRLAPESIPMEKVYRGIDLVNRKEYFGGARGIYTPKYKYSSWSGWFGGAERYAHNGIVLEAEADDVMRSATLIFWPIQDTELQRLLIHKGIRMVNHGEYVFIINKSFPIKICKQRWNT